VQPGEGRLSTRDGPRATSSSSTPEQRVDAAANVLYLIAAFNAVLGVIAGLFQIGFLQRLGVGWGSLITAAVYGGLGVFVKRRSLLALVSGVVLFVADGAFFLVSVARATRHHPSER
jgi:hypothetical protein